MRKLWGGEHSLVDGAGRTVFVLKQGREKFRWQEMFKQQGSIRREDTTHDGRTLSILLLFAWWMILVEAEQAAGAAVVVMG